ncbi:TraR/DksA family transcriptional regulator [Ktedonosporobacter rubrisoli]|uniref:TraR/DksA family transcriptional regulator n=1 Tax=Ktedonosporobacter rubrisoli TaxID=2509675 RepID=A0A4P6JR38_KTERU|nr:TraR/DksA C4-type zinc finger protein [Ktedonosporobacter rubrisoli]QBD77743.1 TraR/DksA family transcriptional regulator [Ktedonosporobacter rubrisoli]
MTLDMQQIKQRLESKRADLKRQIGDLTEAHPKPVDPIELSEGPQEFEETAVDFLETQKEQSVLVNEQALLTEVNEALKRIKDGSYGRCVVDGEPIPEKRLEAIPWAARCAKHEQALEERNLSEEELYNADTQ